MTCKQFEYDYYRDGEFVMSGTVKEIAQKVGRSIPTVGQWRYRPPKGVRMVRKGERPEPDAVAESPYGEGSGPMETPIVTTKEPEMTIDKWRETRIDYTESLGDAYKSLSIETYLTFDELVALVRELRGDAE